MFYHLNPANCWKPIATFVAGVITLATFATSANARPENQLVSDIIVIGTGTDIASGTTSTIAGTVTFTSLSYNETSQSLVFEGQISGTAAADGTTTQIANHVFVTTGSLDSSGAKKCDIVNLDLGPLNLDLLGLQVDLSAIDLDVSAIKGKGKLLGNLLCGLTGLLNPPDPDMIQFQLTRINSIIGTVLENLQVQGDLDTSGTFTGFLSINGFSVDSAGTLIVMATLNGIAENDGTTTNVLNQILSTTGTLGGSNVSGKGKKCEILTLDLAPTHIDALGLTIDLGAVNADLTAVTGSGKLLGNLLCKLTQALDTVSSKPNAASKLLKTTLKINQLLH